MDVRYLALASSIILGAAFLVSAVPKLRRPKTFTVTVISYDILPLPLARVYARLVPVAEVALSLILLTGILVRLAAIAFALLLLSYMVGVVVNLARGRELDCGCFGSHSRKIGRGVVADQAVLIALAAAAAASSASWLGISHWSLWRLLESPGVQPIAGLAICCVAASVCDLVLGRGAHRIGFRNA